MQTEEIINLYELLHEITNQRLEAFLELPQETNEAVKEVLKRFTHIRHCIRLSSLSNRDCHVLWDYFRASDEFTDILLDIGQRFYIAAGLTNASVREGLLGLIIEAVTLNTLPVTLPKLKNIIGTADTNNEYIIRDPNELFIGCRDFEWKQLLYSNWWLVITLLLNLSNFRLVPEKPTPRGVKP